MVGRRKLSDPSLNHIFNAPSIDVQFTLSFQLTNFGLKCLYLGYWIAKHVWHARKTKKEKQKFNETNTSKAEQVRKHLVNPKIES